MAKAKAPKPLPQLLNEPPYPKAPDEAKGKTHQICDKVSQYAVYVGSLAFFMFVLKRLDPKLTTLFGVLPNRPAGHPNSPLRICDFIVVLKIIGKVLLGVINIEIQIEAKGKEVFRALDYKNCLVQAYNFIKKIIHHDFVPGTCFVYLRKKAPKSMSLSFQTSTRDGYTGPSSSLEMVSDSFCMADVNAREFLEQVRNGHESSKLLYWVPLMDGADQDDIIQEWRQLADIHIAKEELDNLAFVALTFAEVADREDVWKFRLEDLNPMKSKLHEEWYAAAKAEGKVEGKVSGVLEATQDLLLTLLGNKFPQAMGAVSGLLQNLNDPVRLKELFNHAVNANTEKEFRNLAGV